MSYYQEELTNQIVIHLKCYSLFSKILHNCHIVEIHELFRKIFFGVAWRRFCNKKNVFLMKKRKLHFSSFKEPQTLLYLTPPDTCWIYGKIINFYPFFCWESRRKTEFLQCFLYLGYKKKSYHTTSIFSCDFIVFHFNIHFYGLNIYFSTEKTVKKVSVVKTNFREHQVELWSRGFTYRLKFLFWDFFKQNFSLKCWKF